ncbi:hypothetical protein CI238_05777 [Colletotrichum incanum]|uniref:Uncharacterized protein n=1 Tax=Colletotrichum incanum TaxID=1573173 RepID=A0A162NDK3_COLIC|nr:hypothetical protein CI238_05777 [Colletotrichum incanum]
MATITSLSNELLLHIGSFLHLHIPAKELVLAYRHERARAIILHEHRASFLSLCVVSKLFNVVFARELFRLVSIHSRNSPRQLLSLLRLLRSRPGLFNSIERIYLDLRPSEYGASSLSYTQMRPMKTWAEELGITVDNNIETALMWWQSHDRRILSSRFFPDELQVLWKGEQNSVAVLTAILLANVHRVKEVALSTTAGVLRHIPVCLGIPGRPSVAPRHDLLPALKSMVIRSTRTEFQGEEMHRLAETEIHYLAAISKNISEVYLSEICVFQDENTSEIEKPKSQFASLIFQDVHFRFDDDSLEALLMGFSNISKFACYNTAVIYEPPGFFMPTPRRLADALAYAVRAKKLQRLCIYMDPVPYVDTCQLNDFLKEDTKACKPAHALVSLEAFVNLEHLYIDKWSFRNGPKTKVLARQTSGKGTPAETEVQVHDVILKLPLSLKRLHVGGCADGITESLSWLANNHNKISHLERLRTGRCRGEGMVALANAFRAWRVFPVAAVTPLELLPIELLLTIASFLWSNQPAKKRLLDASTSRKHGALARTLHRERSSVIGFSSACKSLHEALKAEKYRFVSIHGHNSAQKLLSLLRLIRVRPEIGDHIQQLHLQLIPLACDTTSVSYEQLRSLKTWAETIGIVVEDATLLNALNYESGEDHEDSESCFPSTNQYEHDKTCLRILCSMLFYYLRDVKEITLSTSWELFSTLPDQLKSSRSDSQQSLWPRNFLPALQSLAFETNLPSVGESDCMNSCDIIGMAQIARGVSDVYLRGFGLHHNTGMAFSNKFLHSLVLQDVYLPSYRGGSVYAFLESCKNLSKFIYIRSDNIHQTYEYSIPSPLRIQEALKSSRKSLRTLCFYYGPTLRDHEIGRFFESFKNFLCLENLWVDAWSCGWAVEDNIESEVEMESESNFVEEAPTPASVTKLIQTLPPSLRRLHIDGPVDCVYDSLRWLALHCRDGMMPLLKEMAFDDLDSKIASEKLKIMFKEAGVKKCRVDTNLIMW